MSFFQTREDVIRHLQQAGSPEKLHVRSKLYADRIDLASFDLHGVDLHGARLRYANLEGTNLAGANLKGTSLVGANFKGANLGGANLKRAWLVGANFRGANLTGVELGENHLPWFQLGDLKTWFFGLWWPVIILNRGAKLTGANLSGDNLSGYNLRGFDLRNVNLSGTDLSGTDLRQAKLDKAILDYTNLSRATVSSKQLQRAASLQGTTMPDQVPHAIPLVSVGSHQPVYVGYASQQPYAEQPYVPQPTMSPYTMYHGPAAPQKNSLAIAGFVLGIIGILTSWLLFGALACIPGIILSALGLRRSEARGRKGLAIAGLVLSIIGVLVTVAIIIIANMPSK